MSLIASNNSPPAVPEEHDKHGNLVMNLSSIGINNVVRFVRTENGIRFSMVDVVKAVTGKSQDYCTQIVRRLSEEVQTDVRANCTEFKFKGPGQREITSITYEGVLKLIMALPGINAREMRTKFASVLQRYFAGDITLIEEIADNYVSPEPINNMAREALPQPDTKELRKKRRQETAEWNMQRKRKFMEAEDEVKVMKILGMGKLDLMDMEHAKILQHEKTMSKAAIDREQDISKEVVDREKTVSKEVVDREKTVSKEQIERGRTLIQIESEHLKLKQDELKTQQELLKVTKELQDELKTQQELLQVTKELQEVNKEKCTMDPPYTVARVAECYGLLDSIKDMSKREKILACAGKLVRSDRFNLAPLPVKTAEGAYYVYQYAAQSINTLKEAVRQALCMTQKEEKPVITIKHFFHSR